jgi:hypothetical protein
MKTNTINRGGAEARIFEKGKILFSTSPRLRGEKSLGSWLPDMDLNHDKQIQSLLCYRYTIGQAGAFERLNAFLNQSSHA